MNAKDSVARITGAVALLAVFLVHSANVPLVQARSFSDLAPPEPLLFPALADTATPSADPAVRRGGMVSLTAPDQASWQGVPSSICRPDAIWHFSGHVLGQLEPPMPAPPGVVVGLFGSHDSAQMQQPLAIGATDDHGFFMLACLCSPGEDPVPGFPFLSLSIADERYRVLGAWSHSGGLVVEGFRLLWEIPAPAHYGDNDFFVEPSGPPPPGARLSLPLVLKSHAGPPPHTPTPTATRTPGKTPTATPTSTVFPTAEATPTPTPTPTVIPTAGMTFTATPTPTLTATAGVTPSESETPSATPTPSSTPTEGATATPTATIVAGAVLLDDNFDDGDLTGWTSSGGTWTNPGAYMRGEHSADAWNIHSASGADVQLEGTVTLLTSGLAGLSVRTSVEGSTGYDLVLDFAANALWLREQPEAYETGCIFSSPLELNRAYQLKIVAKGETLEGYLDGIKRVTIDDNTYTAGRLGVVIDNATATFDDLKATAVE